MTIEKLSLISLILSIILIIAIICIIIVVMINRKLIKSFIILESKQLEDNLYGNFEVRYSTEGEMFYNVKLPLPKDLSYQSMDCTTPQKPRESEFECTDEPECQNHKIINIDPDLLSRVTSIIYRDITNTDNLIEVISSELCISNSQLNRRIKLMTGMTTTNFILKTRLNRAKKQLTVTQKPIGEVAMDCGFNDFAYFSRSFKKEFDMTPTTFQRTSHSVN